MKPSISAQDDQSIRPDETASAASDALTIRGPDRSESQPAAGEPGPQAPQDRLDFGRNARGLVLGRLEPAASARGADPSAFSARPEDRGFRPRRRPPSSFRRIDWFRVGAGAALLALGWAVGADMFYRHADVARLQSQIHQMSARIGSVQTRAAQAPRVSELRSLGQKQSGLRAEIASLKSRLEAANRQTQAREAELHSALARLEKDARLEQLSGRIDRLEHQLSSANPTASIPPAKPAPASAPERNAKPSSAHASPNAQHGSSNAQLAKAAARAQRDLVPLEGFVIRSVDHGAALVEDEAGLHEVSPGDFLPGAGRVERIERRGGDWVVVTSAGTIDESGY